MKASTERGLSQWLRGHHGVITVQEAGPLGVSHDMLLDLVRQGRLRRAYRGVYVEQPQRGNAALTSCAAAATAVGPEAALSHRTAAWMWGLLPQAPPRVELVVPAPWRHVLPGVLVHRSRLPVAVRTRDGLRVTEPVRTIVDVASVAPRQLATVVDRALADQIVHISHLEAAARPAAEHRQRGVAVLRSHLHERGHLGAPAPSVLESRMMRDVIHRYELPTPTCEVTAGWFGQYRLDFAFLPVLFAVEVDGYVWHASAEHMAADNARRNHLRTIGWHLLVYTWVDVTRHAEHTAQEILANYRRLVA